MEGFEDSLITIDEAEKVALGRQSPNTLRTPFLIVVSLSIAVITVFVALILISLGGSRTGIEALVPFLSSPGVTQAEAAQTE